MDKAKNLIPAGVPDVVYEPVSETPGLAPAFVITNTENLPIIEL